VPALATLASCAPVRAGISQLARPVAAGEGVEGCRGMAAPPPQRPPPPPAGSQNGPDLDVQAVEGIPRETLVALLKRKDKEAQAATSKLEKLEERYVKVVRHNKILMEDRISFLRYCNELLPDSDAVFEEAAAQEIPVNCEALVRNLGTWRGAFEAAREDRRVFQQFAELCFPGDEAVAQLFVGPTLSAEAFDMLQHRWVDLEELHNQSIASMNSLAREQVMAKTRELEDARSGRRDSEQRVDELREQLTRLAREKAQILTQRLQGGAPAEPSTSSSDRHISGAGGGGESGELLNQEQALREAREALDSAERRERTARELMEAAERREQELRSGAESQQTEVRRLHGEMERLREDDERHRVQARQLLQQKDEVHGRLEQKMGELEQEMSSNSFIERYAEQQAGREAEQRGQQRQMQQLGGTVNEIQRLLSMSYSQERVLKDRIRELEQSEERQGQVGGDYLKHVVMKYIEYNQRGDLKSVTLVPVLCTLLSLSAEERRTVETGTIPTPLLYLNQAVGDAASWLHGGNTQPQARPGESLHPALEPMAVYLEGATAEEQSRPA